MSEYTPGPWILSTVEGEEDFLMVGGGDGSDVVADIRTDWDTEKAFRRFTANARLIAAAPDLLAALEGLVEEASCNGQHGPLLNRAISAIDAATGGTGCQ